MSRVIFKRAVSVALICANVIFATAQRPIEIALYDLEQLYDTTSNEASAQRYTDKVERSVAVIDSIAAPIIALLGVESEQVVRHLVSESKMEYCYAHRTLDYFDKLDCALLYQADYMAVESIEASRYIMRVVGIVDSAKVEFILARRGDKLHSIADPTQDRIVVIMGNFTHQQLTRLGAEDPLQALAKRGLGDTHDDMGWHFNSRFGVATPTTGDYSIEGGIFNAEWVSRCGRHLPTYIRINVLPAPRSADDGEYAK
ncbi:MAG: hypothetical protein SNH63_06270 [Rikenellaceae bacterium]